jgi:hypothetical protein
MLVMRRVAIILLTCTLGQMLAPAAAQAWILDWIDELSGPGPFRGMSFEWRLVCFSEPDPAQRDAVEETDEVRLGTARALQFLGPGCFFKQVPVTHRRRASINLKMGLLEAKRNDLSYALPEADRDVKLTTLLPSVSWRPTRSLELTVGGGVFWFSGPQFASFHRVVLEPLRADVKPLAAINQARGADPVWWDELVSLRGGFLIVPRGFDARDFGAIPGTFRVSRDTLKSAAIFLDLDSLVMHLRRAERTDRNQRPAGRR